MSADVCVRARACVFAHVFAPVRQREYERRMHEERQRNHRSNAPTLANDPSYHMRAQQAHVMREAERAKGREAQALYELLLSFPTHLWAPAAASSADDDELNNDSRKECAICLSEFVPGERCKQLTCEGAHCFHSRCLRQWLQTSGRVQCPTCRAVCTPPTPPPAVERAADRGTVEFSA